jgi:hypothetical protein
MGEMGEFGSVGTMGTMGSVGIIGSSAARGVGAVGMLLALLTVVALLVLVASLWWAAAAHGWRALWRPVWRRRIVVWWRRSERWVGHWRPLRAALAADALLCHLLAPAEYRQLRRKGYLEVASGGHPGRIYRVPRGGGQVAVVEGGRVVERLCVQPVEHLPPGEAVLVHKLLIEADEEGYLAAANHLAGDRFGEDARPAGGERVALGPWLGRRH